MSSTRWRSQPGSPGPDDQQVPPSESQDDDDTLDADDAQDGRGADGDGAADQDRTGGETLKVDAEADVLNSFDAAVTEGAQRLNRSLSNLLATGLMAGLDVGFGVLALLFVEHETGSPVLGGLAFTIGFLALALGRSELFTENFLVPVTTVITRKGTVRQLGRLWAGTYTTNLLGGWLVAVLVVLGYPDLHEIAAARGEEIMARALSMESFVLAVLAGAAITLMTWMERNADTEGGRLVAVMAFGFLLGGTHMNHVIVISIKMFAALHVGGTPFDYWDWLQLSTFALVGNMIGGLGLVTVLRMVQVGGSHIERRRRTSLSLRTRDGRRRIRGD